MPFYGILFFILLGFLIGILLEPHLSIENHINALRAMIVIFWGVFSTLMYTIYKQHDDLITSLIDINESWRIYSQNQALREKGLMIRLWIVNTFFPFTSFALAYIILPNFSSEKILCRLSLWYCYSTVFLLFVGFFRSFYELHRLSSLSKDIKQRLKTFKEVKEALEKVSINTSR